ncbi:MAG: class I adenylate-forming enzyme family protein [Phycisphaerales bacterium]
MPINPLLVSLRTNLGIALTSSFLRRANRPIIVDDRRTYHGKELMVAGMHIADLIEGKSSTQRVGLLIPTSGAMGAACYGVWLAGRAAVPFNYLLDEPTLNYVVNDCGCDLIIASRALVDHLGFVPKCKRIVYLEDMDFRKPPSPRLPKATAPSELAVVLYTSGTSGKPKGVMLTHKNLLSNAMQMHEHIGVRSDDIFLGVLPQFHSFGLTALTLVPMLFGCKVVYSARFMPKKIIELMREHRPSIYIAIPSMYNALMTVKSGVPEDFASLRLTVSGGEPLPADVRERFLERYSATIVEGYGLTETAPVTHVLLPEDCMPGTVGRPVPRLEQIVVDPETDRVLPHNTDGELRMRGPNVMQGYLGLEAESSHAFDERGFFRTGDMAQIDEGGFLRITGRIKEMMIVGGENVFPREIEEVLNAHPSVHDSGVIGQQDPMRGEVPIAFVEAAEDAMPDPDDLVRWCREGLPGYKVPRRVVVIESLPRNATGKIMRRLLKPELDKLEA